jgi:indoleamine 2,3-dioxygenase
MSPHKLEILPSRAALPQYGISKNGFLPEEPPLERLPQRYYQPWEHIMEQLPKLIEKQQIREKVDALPVLDTAQLSSEAEWQRACSIMALIAQGYIWTGPEPSQVSREHLCA